MSPAKRSESPSTAAEAVADAVIRQDDMELAGDTHLSLGARSVSAQPWLCDR